jgi:hypothetical protein
LTPSKAKRKVIKKEPVDLPPTGWDFSGTSKRRTERSTTTLFNKF